MSPTLTSNNVIEHEGLCQTRSSISACPLHF